MEEWQAKYDKFDATVQKDNAKTSPPTSQQREAFENSINDYLRSVDIREPNSNSELAIEKLRAMINGEEEPAAKKQPKAKKAKKEESSSEGA